MIHEQGKEKMGSKVRETNISAETGAELHGIIALEEITTPTQEVLGEVTMKPLINVEVHAQPKAKLPGIAAQEDIILPPLDESGKVTVKPEAGVEGKVVNESDPDAKSSHEGTVWMTAEPLSKTTYVLFFRKEGT